MQKHKVLLVDDEPAVREYLKEVLSPHVPSLQFQEADNGSDGLKRMSRERFDIVISDLKMPKMDGLTMLGAVKSIPSDIRPKHLVILSALVTPADLPLELRGITYLEKPPAESRLVAVIKNLLGLATPPGQDRKITADMINPFIEATMRVLQTTAQISAERERVFLRTEDSAMGDISAVVALNSDDYLGSLALSFEEPCFLAIVEGMLGEKFPQITPEISDACGEVCNQILGGAKKVLNEMGHSVRPAIPTVISGKGHRIQHFSKGPCLAVSFRTPHGGFTIEIIIQLRAKT